MRIVACLLALVLGSIVAMPSPAAAGSSTDAALALGSFAVLNQLLRGETVLHDLFGRSHAPRETVVVHQPARVIYAPPPPTVIYAPAPPPTVIYAPAPAYVVPPGHAKRHHHHHHHGAHRHGHRWHHKHGWK